jgi:hypothetical protein
MKAIIFLLATAIPTLLFAHDDFEPGVDSSVEAELNAAWGALTPGVRAALRPQQRRWLANRELLAENLRNFATQKQVEYLWSKAPAVAQQEYEAEVQRLMTQAGVVPSTSPAATPAPAQQHAQAYGTYQRVVYQFNDGNTTSEQATALQRLWYAEVACNNAVKTATDPNVLQQDYKIINEDILALVQFWPLKYEDMIYWNSWLLYRPIGNKRIDWQHL